MAEPVLFMPVGSRENVRSKALRYLIEGRLTVLMVKGGRIYAECRGTDQVWHPVYTDDRWGCDCPQRSNRCSHLLALQLVTTRPTNDAA